MASESCSVSELSPSSQPNPSSFKNFNMGFVPELSVEHSTLQSHRRLRAFQSSHTPVSSVGYSTPSHPDTQLKCQTCHKGFEFKNSFRRHLKSCKLKTGLHKRKRKLMFSTPKVKKVKTDLFDELSSSPDSHSDGCDDSNTTNGKCLQIFII